MKKILILFLLISPLVMLAQKKLPKPNLSKAERAFRDGKFALAKEVIDITVVSEKFSNNAKAWYLRGVIYASLDTTTNKEFKSLVEKPFAIAKTSFETSKKLENKKTPIYLTNKDGFPILPDQTKALFAQKYFDTGLKYYKEKKNYKAAFSNMEKAVFFIPEDTSVLLNAGLFFAPAAEENEKAVVYLKKYLALKGSSEDAYTMLFSIYRDKLKDDEQALTVVKEAVGKYPKNEDFPKYELDMYIKLNRLEEARAAMEKQAEKNPNDADISYYLGVINQELKDNDAAKKWYEKAIASDPNHLNSRIAIAEFVYLDAKVIKKKMNALGISKEDRKKRLELDKMLVEKLKIALPYWQTCEKIDSENPKVLDSLLSIYTNLGMDAEIKKTQKKMKSLGIF